MKKVITAVIFLFTVLISSAGEGGYKIEALSVEEGLLSSNVWAIAQDSTGYIWIGTDKGVARYDGYEFYNFSSSDVADNGLKGDLINVIYVDKENGVWFGSDGQGLFKLNRSTNRFQQILFPDSGDSPYNSNRVTSITEDSKGNIWTSTLNGLGKVEIATGEVKRFLTRIDTQLVYRSSFPTLWYDGVGNLWITDGYYLGELTCFNIDEEREINRIQLPEEVGYGADIDKINDKIYISTASGYIVEYKIVGNSKLEYIDQYFIGDHKYGFLELLPYSDDKFLLGTYRNLSEFNLNTKKFNSVKIAGDSELIPRQTSISSLLKDREGNVWMSTDEDGVGKISAYKNPFEHIKVWPAALNKRDKVYGLAVDEKDNLWIGTSEGMVKYSQSTNQYEYFEYKPEIANTISNPIISSILISSDKNLYLGTIGGGLDVYNPETKKFTNYHEVISDSNSLNWNAIRSLHESKDGYVWIGSFGGGLEFYDKNKKNFRLYWVDENDTSAIAARRIMDIEEDSLGNLWLASMMSGVEYFDRSKQIFKHYKLAPNDSNSISSNKTTSLYLQGDSLLWIGTSTEGLNKYDIQMNKFYQYTTKDGLGSNSIASIAADNRGQLWMSTSSGISRFDPIENNFVNFTYVDGLINNEYTPSSSAVDSGGYIYFGGDKGVTKFHPDSVNILEINTKPVITRYSLIDRDKGSTRRLPFKTYYYPSDKIEFSSADYHFTVEFSALSYILPEKLEYAYKLAGFQEDWIVTDHRNRVATYTNLPPGEYEFQLALVNAEGNISENKTAIAVIVNPLFYQTVWFSLLVVLIIAFLLYWLYRLRINKIKEVESLRLKIASDLHDEVGSTLTKISMRAQMLEMQVEEDKKASNLKRISEQARETVSIMQDIVWTIDSRNDKVKDLLVKMQDTAHSILTERNIQVKFSAQNLEADKDLSPGIRQNLFLIMKEAVHNIAKHSDADSVEIILENKKDQFSMSIHDNGSKFCENEYNVGQGLKNMRMRGDKINGKVSYAKKEGFMVELTMPSI